MRWPSRRRTRAREPRYQIVEVIGASEQLGEAVDRASERIAEQRAARSAGGGLRRFVLLAAAAAAMAAAGYAALRGLSGSKPDAGSPDDAPGGPPVDAARDADSVRGALEAGLAAGRRASAEAERELREELRQRREGGA